MLEQENSVEEGEVPNEPAGTVLHLIQTSRHTWAGVEGSGEHTKEGRGAEAAASGCQQGQSHGDSSGGIDHEPW
jgi:hypothetical protein